MRTLISLFLITSVCFSCSKPVATVDKEVKNSTLIDRATATRFDFSKPDARIKAALTMLEEEERGRAFINSAQITVLNDVKGKTHDVFLVLYTIDENNITMAIPVSRNNESYIVDAPGCKQRCIASSWCSGCTLTIIENCKTIDCRCSTGSGTASCDPEIISNP